MTPSNNDKQHLVVTFPDGATAKKIVKIVTSNKPYGASQKSEYPYYNKRYGEWIKAEVDLMIANRQDLTFPFSVFCKDVTPRTLYSRVNQAIRYLVEKMDDDNVYEAWFSNITTAIDNRRGAVTVCYKPEFITGDMPRASLVTPLSAQPIWRRNLDTWLESSTSEPFVVNGLCLTVEQITALTKELDGVVGIMASIEGDNISIIKTL